MEIGSPNYSIITHEMHYYTWEKEAKTPGQVYGYHYQDPLTNFISGNTVENVFEQEPQEITYTCKLTIGTNKEDKIVMYHLTGKCNKKNTFLD